MTVLSHVCEAPSLHEMPQSSKAQFLSWHLILKAESQLEFLKFTAHGATMPKYECEHPI